MKRSQLSSREMVSPAGEPATAVISSHIQCSAGTTAFAKLLNSVPLLVLLTVIAELVEAAPVADVSAPWRRWKLTLGLLPPLSTASTLVMDSEWGARSTMRFSLACGAASQMV
mgnify:FL=1